MFGDHLHEPGPPEIWRWHTSQVGVAIHLRAAALDAVELSEWPALRQHSTADVAELQEQGQKAAERRSVRQKGDAGRVGGFVHGMMDGVGRGHSVGFLCKYRLLEVPLGGFKAVS